jgi:UDP-GlcNAc:undecaprenyl-phosphate GlcNAc-1-phosphate transferase
MMELYALPFFTSFIVTLGVIVAIVFVTRRFNIRNPIFGSRHVHDERVSRLGGVALICGFIVAVVIDQNLVLEPIHAGVLGALVLLLTIALVDDFVQIDWKIQLFFLVALSVLIFILGVRVPYISNPFGEGVIQIMWNGFILFGFLFVVVWMLVIINSMNWLDGMDGLSSSVSLVAALVIFLIALLPEVNQPPLAIMAIAMAGSLCAFFIFNFPPAQIMAGTSGSWYMGFMIAVLAIFSGAKIATALLVLAIPIVDFFWVIWERLVEKAPIVKADRRHLHYKLQELGWSNHAILALYFSITALMASVALIARDAQKVLALGVSAGFLFFLTAFMYKAVTAKRKRREDKYA